MIHSWGPMSSTQPTASTQEDEDGDHAAGLARYKMVDARLRRLCEKKPSGRLNVPQAIHEQWLQVGGPRDELRQMLEQLDFDKDIFFVVFVWYSQAYAEYPNQIDLIRNGLDRIS